jgi:hypothetical protein
MLSLTVATIGLDGSSVGAVFLALRAERAAGHTVRPATGASHSFGGHT